MKKYDPLKQIRKQCIECSGGNSLEAKFCSGVTCPLWPLRFGMRYNTALRNLDKDLFKPENFMEDGKFTYLETARLLEGRFFAKKQALEGLPVAKQRRSLVGKGKVGGIKGEAQC